MSNDEFIPEDVMNELTIPRVSMPRKEDFRGSVTPEEIHKLKDERDIAIAATFNKIESQLEWLMDKVPPIYTHLRSIQARQILAERRTETVENDQRSDSSVLKAAKAFLLVALTSILTAVIAKAVGK